LVDLAIFISGTGPWPHVTAACVTTANYTRGTTQHLMQKTKRILETKNYLINTQNVYRSTVPL